MTKDAQFALRRGMTCYSCILCIYLFSPFLCTHTPSFLWFIVIEKYTRNTRFSLICNHVNKIIPALQSRCTRFRFAPLDSFHVTERLKHVIEAEK
jgi:DNA polymerase III delta prime subunit